MQSPEARDGRRPGVATYVQSAQVLWDDKVQKKILTTTTDDGWRTVISQNFWHCFFFFKFQCFIGKTFSNVFPHFTLRKDQKFCSMHPYPKKWSNIFFQYFYTKICNYGKKQKQKDKIVTLKWVTGRPAFNSQLSLSQSSQSFFFFLQLIYFHNQ